MAGARYDDPIEDVPLFHIPLPPPISLADKFVIPPMTTLDRRSGEWRDRRNKWLSLGIQSELGRSRESGAYATLSQPGRQDFMARLLRGEAEPNAHGGGRFAIPKTDYGQQDKSTARSLIRPGNGRPQTMIQQAGGISVFDPVVCELVYRWFTPPNGHILDPFAGGSVRGIIASHLGRNYTGIDLREEQIAANQAQIDIANPAHLPVWKVGDSATIPTLLPPEWQYDAIFSCPPYGDLEVYSDHPADISNMAYPAFLDAYRTIIGAACTRLRPNRFAAWVISDFRDNKGLYRGFIADTIAAFRDAGLAFYNEAIIIDPIGSAALRVERQFVATRKLGRTHQHLLIFVKGNPKQATWDCGGGLGRTDNQEKAA